MIVSGLYGTLIRCLHGYGYSQRNAVISPNVQKGFKNTELCNSLRRVLVVEAFTFDAEDLQEPKQRILELKQIGVNILIVRAFQNPYDRIYRFAIPQHQPGVYFETEAAPVVDPLLKRILSLYWSPLRSKHLCLDGDAKDPLWISLTARLQKLLHTIFLRMLCTHVLV